MKYCTLLVKINNNYLNKTYIFFVFCCMVRTKLQKQAKVANYLARLMKEKIFNVNLRNLYFFLYW